METIRAHGVVVSHPLSMREALGSIPSVSKKAWPRKLPSQCRERGRERREREREREREGVRERREREREGERQREEREKEKEREREREGGANVGTTMPNRIVFVQIISLSYPAIDEMAHLPLPPDSKLKCTYE